MHVFPDQTWFGVSSMSLDREPPEARILIMINAHDRLGLAYLPT